MNPDTAIQAEDPRTTPALAREAAPRPRTKPQRHPVLRVLDAVASLRVTVALFVMSLVLVFYGTLAQADQGIQTVVNSYFRSAIVKIPLEVICVYVNYYPKLFNPDARGAQFDIPGWIPYPGGWLLGGLLVFNLLAAHIVRFKLSWKRAGIIVLHAGILVLMAGEVITGTFAVEGRMQIHVGESINYLIRPEFPELAFVRTVSPKQDEISIVTGDELRTGNTINDPALPFRVEINEYMVNSTPARIQPDETNLATDGVGKFKKAVRQPEATGVEERHDQPSAYVTLTDRDTGKSVGTYLVSYWLEAPQTVKHGDKEYQLTLRPRRSYQPYTFTLTKFDHIRFQGTPTPRDYRSHVHLVDPTAKEDRQIQIYMNAPLRYHGETFYQSSFTNDPRTGQADSTILQVVRNPASTFPYIGCTMVSLGMLLHFGITLVRFLERRTA